MITYKWSHYYHLKQLFQKEYSIDNCVYGGIFPVYLLLCKIWYGEDWKKHWLLWFIWLWFFLKIVSCKSESLISKAVGWLFLEMFDNNKVHAAQILCASINRTQYIIYINLHNLLTRVIVFFCNDRYPHNLHELSKKAFYCLIHNTYIYILYISAMKYNFYNMKPQKPLLTVRLMRIWLWAKSL